MIRLAKTGCPLRGDFPSLWIWRAGERRKGFDGSVRACSGEGDGKETVKGTHTLTSGQTQPANLCAFIFRDTLMKRGILWMAGSCVPWEQSKELKVLSPEKRRLWGS